MIPKKIHYCWFGRGPLPDLALKCISSWKKYLPDYEIKEWNEDNFDINMIPYVKEAYEAKKYAFVSDVARLYALVTEGGIYMDTDVEVLKPLDNFLTLDAFSGFENEKCVPTGIMACRKSFPLFESFLLEYEKIHFKIGNSDYDTTTNVIRITDSCCKKGLILNNTTQTIDGFKLYPKDYFCPKSYGTGELKITNNTYTIHHFNGSWHDEQFEFSFNLSKYLSKKMPKILSNHIGCYIGFVKYKGVKSLIKHLYKRFNDSYLNKK